VDAPNKKEKKIYRQWEIKRRNTEITGTQLNGFDQRLGHFSIFHLPVFHFPLVFPDTTAATVGFLLIYERQFKFEFGIRNR